MALSPAKWKWRGPLGPFGPGQNKGNPPFPSGLRLVGRFRLADDKWCRGASPRGGGPDLGLRWWSDSLWWPSDGEELGGRDEDNAEADNGSLVQLFRSERVSGSRVTS
jgi:hypothetical protein